MKRILLLLLVITGLATFVKAQSTVTGTVHAGGLLRTFRVYLPKGYIQGESMPLIIELHAYKASGADDEVYTQFQAVADTGGFIVAYPDGIKDSGGDRYWNVGWPFLPDTVNDAQFISVLIDSLHALYNIDLGRVYASGLSNGGFLAYSLATRLNNKIAATASVSGGMYPPVFDTCQPGRAVPVLEIHGTADNLVPYNGGSGMYSSVNTDSLIRFWANNDGCNPTPDTISLPNTNTGDGTTTTEYVFKNGYNNATCVLYKIINGQHADWPGSTKSTTQDWNASSAIWDFFKQYNLTLLTGVKNTDVNVPLSVNFNPNPGENIVNVSLPAEWNGHLVQVEICDVTGRAIKDYPLTLTSPLSLNVTGMQAGYYIARFCNGQKTYVGKLVKE